MTDILARRYRGLLRAYPKGYRQQRGDELLSTLMDGAEPGRRWPPAREAIGLLTSGVRSRLRSDKAGSTCAAWVSGTRAALVILLAVELADLVIRLRGGPHGRIFLVTVMLGLITFLAVLRDYRPAALAATLLWQAASVWGGVVSWSVATATVILILLTTARRTRRAALPGTWWLAIPTALAILHWPQLLSSETVYTYDYRQVVTISVIALCAVATMLDERAAFVAGGLLIAQCLDQTVALTWTGDNPTGAMISRLSMSWWGAVSAIAATTLLVGGHLVARHRTQL
jgi:hypothetical protein